MKKVSKTTLSLLLVIALLFSVCAVPAMAEEEKGNFVFIGDSMSFDFVEKNNYLDPMDVYPEQAARFLGLEMTNAARLPGGRITDAYTLMSDYEGDDYFKQHFSEDSKEEYQKTIANAEVITVQMGYSGLSIYVLDNLESIFGGDELHYSADLSQLFTGDELSKIMPFADKCVELAKAVIDNDTVSAFKTYIAQLSDAEKEALNSLFGEDTVNTLCGVGDTVDKLMDTLIYFMAAHLIHFDRAVERLITLNPDAELYIMGLTNPIEHMKLGFSLGDLSYSLPLGDYLGVFFDMMNLYMKVLSPYSTKYYFVDNISHADCFGEKMARDEDCARSILYTYYNGSWSGHDNTESEAYQKADARAYGVMKALQNTQTIDITKALAALPDDLSSLSLNMDESALDKLTAEYIDENGELTASYLDQIMAHGFMFTMLKGIYVHPTQAGHDAEAPLLIAAMQAKQVNPLAIAYHKLAAPMEKTVDALNKSGTIDEFICWVNAVKDMIKDNEPVVDEGDDDADADDDDDQDQDQTPEKPQPTTVLGKITVAVKTVVKTVTSGIKSVFTKIGSIFKK